MTLLKTAPQQWRTLRKAWKGVRRDCDEESVHNLRVASRRIGSSLFLIDSILLSSQRSRARRLIKRLMKKLGPLRDVQVQLSIVKNWSKRKAPQAFQTHLIRVQSANCRVARAYLTPERERKIRQALKTLEHDARKGLRALQPSLVRARLQSALDAQRAELQSALSAATNASNAQKLHRLRVAAKRLRYSLESIYPSRIDHPDSELRRLRRYQRDLGYKRDLAILNNRLREWRSSRRAH